MKKFFFLSMLFTLLSAMIYGQHLIRVNNEPAADADYTTIQAANDNASPGDTIYIEGSPSHYEGATIDKKLTLIGPGYFLADNDSTQANAFEARMEGVLDFAAGSMGSQVMGMILNHVYIRDNEIVISRCNLHIVYTYDDSNNILITQNYIDNNIQTILGKLTNSIISNNIIKSQIYTNSSSYPLQITNNIVMGSGNNAPVSSYYSTISNNIFTSSVDLVKNTGNSIINNLYACDGTDANGNKYNIAMTSVFVDYNGNLGYSQDEKFKLRNESPAIGAGVSGVDCGAFGGVSPYVLSGLPPLPHIYEATIPGTAYSDEGLSCTIKIKSGK
ncbi:MAG: hypothetical protein JXR52_01975 [Bacteroidales bacterium]|nr:hypothetical protein [Bacteroidales bacterium]